MPQSGETINGCYTLQEKVGEDRFFSTWRATALYSPNSFSLTFLTFPYKSVPKRAFDEFRRLFLSLYTLQNPYVLTPFEYDESGETKYLASHWINGYSLREAIDNGDFSEKDQVINTAIHILRGLAELERIGVRHDVLTPKSLLLSSLNSDYDVPRIRNIGFSLFIDALGAAAEYRDLPRYRTESLREETHERDLYAAGAIITELVSAVDTADLSTLADIGRAFCADTASFTSVNDALAYFLTQYPEKRTVDLIQEHVADVQIDDTMSRDLYRSIEARYLATKESAEEGSFRAAFAESPPPRRSARGRAAGSAPSGDAAYEEPPEDARAEDDDEIAELLPVDPDGVEEAPKGFLARAVSAVRRLFARRSNKHAAPQDETASEAPVADTGPPGGGDSGEASPTPNDAALEGFRKGAPSDPAPVLSHPESHEPQEVDTSRIFEIFRQLKEHFIRTIRPEEHRLRLDHGGSRPQKRSPWHGALRARSGSAEEALDTSAERQAAPKSKKTRSRTAAGEAGPSVDTGEHENAAPWSVTRDTEGEGKDYDFKPGPDYAPGERRGLDDEIGEPGDIDFGSSALRTDREAPTDSEGDDEALHDDIRRGQTATRHDALDDDAAAPDQATASATPVDSAAAERPDADRVGPDTDGGDGSRRKRRRRAAEAAPTQGSHGMQNGGREASERRPKWFWRLVARAQSIVRRLGDTIFRREQ